MSKHSWSAGVAGLAVVVLLGGGAASAQAAEAAFVPFNTFVNEVEAAQNQGAPAAPGSLVPDKPEMARIRAHVLSLYKGVGVGHSFVEGQATFDCVPLMQQPSVRAYKMTAIAAPPPFPPVAPEAAGGRAPDGQTAAETDQDEAGARDAYGNAKTCEAGTFPMRRVTPQDIARFGTLKRFFKKDRGIPGEPQGAAKPAAGIAHKYAHAYQFATNYGGNSELNIWTPNVDTAKGELMSLSQHWYSNYNGSLVQTAEGGWQNQPQTWGVNKSVLFVYWTADGYNNTGCYNTDCAGFVVYSSKLKLGKGFAHYSVYGGAQFEFRLTYRLYKGAWWLAINNTWMGYYPARIYSPGRLAASASEVDYGGETVGSPIYPPMGSGKPASYGFKRAAYQRLITYIANKSSGATRSVNLTPSQESPNCYKIGVHRSGNWGSYFFFGGPGGSSC